MIDDGRVEHARAWSLLAGRDKGHVSTLLRRLEEDPSRGVELGTLQALADAAGVSRVWLIEGLGEPNDVDAPPPSRFRHADAAAVHAARAFVELHRGDDDAGARAEAHAQATLDANAGERWTPDEWLEELRAGWRRRARAVGAPDVSERLASHVRDRSKR